MSSFINDNRGIVEPFTDLPSMALAVAGFIIFMAVVASAYTAYQQKSLVAENYQDASNLAEKLSKDRALAYSLRPDIMDAERIEEISKNPGELIQNYGTYYDFIFMVEAKSDNRAYRRIIKNPDIEESKFGVSASTPVTVRINEVQEVPGTLTVKIWRKS